MIRGLYSAAAGMLTDDRLAPRHPVFGDRGGRAGDRRHADSKHAARRRAC